jgi:hypothetical protein
MQRLDLLVSGTFFAFLAHGVDSAHIPDVSTIWIGDRSNAVRHRYTGLSEILEYLPEARFNELVEAHARGQAPRRLDGRTQLVALLYGQLCRPCP